MSTEARSRRTGTRRARAATGSGLLVVGLLSGTGVVTAGEPDGSAASSEHARRSWRWFGDTLLRGDLVRDLPGGRDDLDRARLRLRGGIRKWFGPAWELTASARGSWGTDDNDDNVRNFDNEKTDDLRADRLSIRWFGQGAGDLLVGKSALVPRLGSMLWDPDLRPVGIAYRGVWNVRVLDTVGVATSWVHPDHPLESGSESRLAVTAADWRIRDGAPTSGGLALSYAQYFDTDRLPSSGLARTNRVEDGRYASDFELVDLRLFVVLAGHGRWPVRLDVDGVRNLGASRGGEDRGGQVALIAGRRDRSAHWEFAAIARRVERDAVLAAFNSDDWWFHTAARGVRIRATYAAREDLWLRLSATAERRDDLSERLHRVLLDTVFEF